MSDGASGAAPLIITGMHRSGTSLLAASIQRLGIQVGERLLPADRHNSRGYFEDVEFLEFQRALLRSACPPGEPGWPDWGWTERGRLDEGTIAAGAGEARRLVESRQKDGGFWGWKDPRTSLLLPYWLSILPDARFLLVYRRPWDVADSILRVGGEAFAAHPAWGLRAWEEYNRRILEFRRGHRGRCVLSAIEAVVERPGELAALLRTRLGLPVDAAAVERAIAEVHDPRLLGRLPGSHPLVAAIRRGSSGAAALHEALETEADLPGGRTAPPPGDALDAALEFHRRLIEADRREERLEGELRSLQSREAIRREEAEAARREIEWMRGSKFWRAQEGWIAVRSLLRHRGSGPLRCNPPAPGAG